ncbi:unnamed protein product [Adineta steineri]|uniref:Uncharacterized protein n=1 Tax=Adineta steineri TaxID=433720 RepID=A0A813QQP7_9BILA|nr:unnamed protein product [Adineta steineri]CAF0771937.1 unnamed protein product [Adineta steineri]CAF1222498.1 unnamed protein product [Adineta steineri]
MSNNNKNDTIVNLDQQVLTAEQKQRLIRISDGLKEMTSLMEGVIKFLNFLGVFLCIIVLFIIMFWIIKHWY